MCGKQIEGKFDTANGSLWFAGTVREFSHSNERHLIRYEDGEQRWHDLEDDLDEGVLRWPTPPPTQAASPRAQAHSLAHTGTGGLKRKRSSGGGEVGGVASGGGRGGGVYFSAKPNKGSGGSGKGGGGRSDAFWPFPVIVSRSVSGLHPSA